MVLDWGVLKERDGKAKNDDENDNTNNNIITTLLLIHIL